MNLRTTSIRRQRQAWACLALLGVVAYFVLVSVLGLGNPFRFFGSHQMRVLLPLVILLRILAREFRWDEVVREEEGEKKSKCEVEEGKGEEKVGGESRWRAEEESGSAEQPVDATPSSRQNKEGATSVGRGEGAASTKEPPVLSPTPTQNSNFSAAPAAESPEACWEKARKMVHNVIPNYEEDSAYLNLVQSAAEGGHVPALLKLSDYAFRRAAFVEAYFWARVARRHLELAGDPRAKELDKTLRKIRREWTANGQSGEHGNFYKAFSLDRGKLARALLRLDSGIEISRMRELIALLAGKGNTDAALFVERRT